MLSLAACPGGGAAGALRVALGAALAKCWGSAGAAGRARGAVRAVGPVQRSVRCVLGLLGGEGGQCSVLRALHVQAASRHHTHCSTPACSAGRAWAASRQGGQQCPGSVRAGWAVCGQGCTGQYSGRALRARWAGSSPCHVQGQGESGQCLGSAEGSTGWQCTGRAVCTGNSGHSIGSVGAVPWQCGQRAGSARRGYGAGRAPRCTGSVGYGDGGPAPLPSQPTRGTCRQ